MLKLIRSNVRHVKTARTNPNGGLVEPAAQVIAPTARLHYEQQGDPDQELSYTRHIPYTHTNIDTDKTRMKTDARLGRQTCGANLEAALARGDGTAATTAGQPPRRGPGKRAPKRGREKESSAPSAWQN